IVSFSSLLSHVSSSFPATFPADSYPFFLPPSLAHRHLHSFPTRRSSDLPLARQPDPAAVRDAPGDRNLQALPSHFHDPARTAARSEEHTSELQSRVDLVCRLLLEKKNKKKHTMHECDVVHLCN